MSIDSVEGIDYQSPLYFWFCEKLTHGMNGCFTASILAGTHFQRTSGVLYVEVEETKNRLSNYSSRYFPNSNWSHSGVFIRWNQTAGNKGTEIIGVDVGGADSAAYSCKGMAQIVRGGLERGTQSPPSICVKAREASGTLGV